MAVHCVTLTSTQHTTTTRRVNAALGMTSAGTMTLISGEPRGCMTACAQNLLMATFTPALTCRRSLMCCVMHLLCGKPDPMLFVSATSQQQNVSVLHRCALMVHPGAFHMSFQCSHEREPGTRLSCQCSWQC